MKNDKIFASVRALTTSALLCAMSVVIGIFCKSALNFAGGLFRITFENLPIILSGIIYGPAVGAAVGIISDLVSFLLSGQVYPLNVIVTLGAGAVGLSAGVVSKYFVKKRGTKQIIAATALSHLIGSLLIKSIGLFSYYGIAVLLRIPTYIIIGGLEILLLCVLFKKSGFRRLIILSEEENK